MCVPLKLQNGNRNYRLYVQKNVRLVLKVRHFNKMHVPRQRNYFIPLLITLFDLKYFDLRFDYLSYSMSDFDSDLHREGRQCCLWK